VLNGKWSKGRSRLASQTLTESNIRGRHNNLPFTIYHLLLFPMIDSAKKIILPRSLLAELLSHSRATAPEECCGLIGSADGELASSIYAMQNVATNPRVAYEAAPVDLFSAQREMRARGESLLAIYHSHPASNNPHPSETDVRLAYYPEAFYIIIGLESEAKVLAFCIGGHDGGWTEVQIETVDK
jgi:proteasome lid subunit RPN8/RPN11